MSVAVTCRFFGGPMDGDVRAINETMLMGLRVPERRVFTASMAFGGDGVSVHTYRWDGTINGAGERRMRWDGEPA